MRVKMITKIGRELLKAPPSPEVDRAAGLVAQSVRWISHTLFCKNEELAWRGTMQSDPVGDADEDSANGKGLVGAHDEALQDDIERPISSPRQQLLE